MGGETLLSIFHYTDFRAFLADWIADRRQSQRGFSLRLFSRRAGFGSHASLHMILTGKRNLSAKALPRLAETMDLDTREARFFADLVAFSQAVSHHERQHHYKRMVRHAKFRTAHEPERHQLEYFSRWYYVAIREMLSLPDFQESGEWISKRLKGAIRPEEATWALKVLRRLKLIGRDARGKLRPLDQSIATSDDVASLAVAQFHGDMTHQAAKALKDDPLRELHLSALTMPLSRKNFEKVRQRLNAFRRELRSLLEDEKHPEEICQINLQLIKLTRRVA